MKRLILVSILISGCSGVPRQPPAGPALPPPTIVEVPEHGIYDRPLAMITYETINRHLGGASTLSEDEKKVFWDTISGHDVVWTGTLVEVGHRHPLAVPVKLRVGRKSRSWDTLVFFNPEHEEKLNLFRSGDAFTFRGNLESFEETTLGIQVTLVQGRFAEDETSPAP